MKKLTPLQIAVHLGAWFPLAWLLWDYVNGNLSVNPIQDITQRTGKYALILLLVTLTVTPVTPGWASARLSGCAGRWGCTPFSCQSALSHLHRAGLRL